MSSTFNQSEKAVNGFVRCMRHVYNPLGFSKGYNAVLGEYDSLSLETIAHRCHSAFLALGYLLGFTLARLQYLSFNGVFCNSNSAGGTGAAPGECYYWLQVPFKIGKSELFRTVGLSWILTIRKA
jgi:hypothetical protein